MFEVKRKPNERHGTTGTATAAIRAYQVPQLEVATVTPATEFDGRAAVSSIAPVLVSAPRQAPHDQTRTPVITGEAHYKGLLPVDGILTGQLGANGGSLGIKQRSSTFSSSRPELAGEISFKDMLRVNGHIAGTVYSKSGTLIIDNSATVEANVEVGVMIVSGTVRGHIVAHQRVELGPSAKIYGNIWTRSISIRDGAVFDGICTMIDSTLH
jgi:cytoskeletal protein CcmA (bactofilin family)